MSYACQADYFEKNQQRYFWSLLASFTSTVAFQAFSWVLEEWLAGESCL